MLNKARRLCGTTVAVKSEKPRSKEHLQSSITEYLPGLASFFNSKISIFNDYLASQIAAFLNVRRSPNGKVLVAEHDYLLCFLS